MYNNVVIIGKVIKEPKLFETANGFQMATMLLRVKRSYRNSNGEFDSDDLEIVLWKNLAEECLKEISNDALVLVSGRLQANNYSKDDKTYYKANIVAEKVSVISC